MTNARIYQDNKSTILLENNGKMSSSKRTKHIKSKFFFVTVKVAQGDIVIEWLPTDQMWVDVNTKPKTGIGYRRDRAMLMNCPMDIPDETMAMKRNNNESILRTSAYYNGHTDANSNHVKRVKRIQRYSQDS